MITRIWQALKSRHHASMTQLEVLRSQPDFRPIPPVTILPKQGRTLFIVGFWAIVIAIGALAWKLVAGH
jgi:hypothetical protein